MVRSAFLAAALVVAATNGWARDGHSRVRNDAGASGNTMENRACRNDAHRFCKNEIPDEFRVASCLQDHRNKISRACRAVLDGHGM